ncbi:MAG: hypothetical protein AB7E79_14100 [Rhodospirillaceae bacterium]
MYRFTAIASSILLHLVFISGFTATGTAATAVAADRAAHVWTV